MTQSVAILGRLPALSIAELESLYGSNSLTLLGTQAVLVNVEPTEIVFKRLGGTVKLTKLLTILDTTDWNQIEKYLQDTILEHAQYLPEGKMTIGLSVYGLLVKPSRINATGLELKKMLKASGRPVRIVPNKTPDLSSAQVLHNNLVGERAWELLFIRHGQKTYLAQTVRIQDIDAYAARDQVRPKRDARVGMLPPKLAQTIINLAHPTADGTVLDPFCGTGVILQEAQLMGYDVYGTDLEPRMIDYSRQNIEWLQDTFHPLGMGWRLEAADATTIEWHHQYTTIACETYLGRPFSALPAAQVLEEVMRDVDTIHRKFLKNVARQTVPGFQMCIAVPAWKTKNGFMHLKVLDSLEELGYTRTSFVHARTQDLIYYRPDQVVGRELVVLTRK